MWSRTENDRQFPSFDVEALDQCLRAWIGRWVQPLVRMSIAGQKSFEPQDVAVIGAADDYRPAAACFEQTYTARTTRHETLQRTGAGK